MKDESDPERRRRESGEKGMSPFLLPFLLDVPFSTFFYFWCPPILSAFAEGTPSGGLLPSPRGPGLVLHSIPACRRAELQTRTGNDASVSYQHGRGSSPSLLTKWAFSSGCDVCRSPGPWPRVAPGGSGSTGSAGTPGSIALRKADTFEEDWKYSLNDRRPSCCFQGGSSWA